MGKTNSYKETIHAHTQTALENTKLITSKWSSRLAGSQSCLETADHLIKELNSFCDKVEHQDFEVRPGAFLGYIRINISLYFLALILLVFQQITWAVALSSLSVIITVLQFFIYWEFVDFLFPKKTGRNIIASIEPIKEVKQNIIVSAHHDSAHIFNFLEDNPLTFNKKVRLGLSSMILMFLFSWLLLLVSFFGFSVNILHWILIGILTILSAFVFRLWFFYDSKKGTPGAGDNMICVAIAMEIASYFASLKKQDKGLIHTRVTIASWDAEEAGLRGARSYVKTHNEELDQIKTYNFNLECMYDHTELNFLTSDLNNFVSLSKEMADHGVMIGTQLGYDVSTKEFPLLAGGTDAAEFAKVGIEATTLSAMSWTNRTKDSAYHTTRDTIDAVDPEAVKRSIDIGIQYILEKDKESREK